jgi:hypothetical protein
MTYGQTANGFNFKALVTDNGNPVANSTITVRVTFKAGSSVKWQETHANVHTDANGIFSVIMGEGTRVAGVSSFDKVDWNVGNMNYTVEVNTGSGYHTLVSNEYFKRVPYAKMAERLGPTSYDVVTENSNIWAKNNGNGIIYQGFRLSHGTDDWYLYMKSDNGFTISNDGIDVFGIDDTNAKAWFKGSLDLPSAGIQFRNTSGGYTNNYYLTNLTDGLTFKYNSAKVMKMHGAASVEVMGKLRAPASGDADMKAYAYGEWYSGSARHTSANVTITKISTGYYKVQFNPSPGGTSDYLVTGNIYADKGFIQIGKASGYFVVNTYDTSGTQVDKGFNFVVFKK